MMSPPCIQPPPPPILFFSKKIQITHTHTHKHPRESGRRRCKFIFAIHYIYMIIHQTSDQRFSLSLILSGLPSSSSSASSLTAALHQRQAIHIYDERKATPEGMDDNIIIIIIIRPCRKAGLCLITSR